jgi:hypothetical protein
MTTSEMRAAFEAWWKKEMPLGTPTQKLIAYSAVVALATPSVASPPCPECESRKRVRELFDRKWPDEVVSVDEIEAARKGNAPVGEPGEPVLLTYEHNHCVFCGNTISGSGTSTPWCHSPANTLPPDTCGHRSHVFLAAAPVGEPGRTPEVAQPVAFSPDGKVVAIIWKGKAFHDWDWYGGPPAAPPAQGAPTPTIKLSELWDLLFPEGTHCEYEPVDVSRWLDAYAEEIEQLTKYELAAQGAPGTREAGLRKAVEANLCMCETNQYIRLGPLYVAGHCDNCGKYYLRAIRAALAQPGAPTKEGA